MGKLSLPGIAVGNIFQIVIGTLLRLGLAAAFVYARDGHFSGREQMASASASETYVLVAEIATFLVLILSGYIAAFIAKQYELQNGTHAAFLYVAQSIHVLRTGHSMHSLGVQLINVVFPPFFCLLGGYIRKRVAVPKLRTS